MEDNGKKIGNFSIGTSNYATSRLSVLFATTTSVTLSTWKNDQSPGLRPVGLPLTPEDPVTSPCSGRLLVSGVGLQITLKCWPKVE